MLFVVLPGEAERWRPPGLIRYTKTRCEIIFCQGSKLMVLAHSFVVVNWADFRIIAKLYSRRARAFIPLLPLPLCDVRVRGCVRARVYMRVSVRVCAFSDLLEQKNMPACAFLRGGHDSLATPHLRC